MFRKGRLSFQDSKTPQVFVLVELSNTTHRQAVHVYFHEYRRKMYTLYEYRVFYHSQEAKKYIEALGAGALVIEVEANNG